MNMKTLLVGAGATSSVLSSILRESLGSKIQLECWDKARGVGGRMSTSRSPDGSITADLGAQYFSPVAQHAEKHCKYYDELINAGVLKPITVTIEGSRTQPKAGDAGTRHLAAVHGCGSIVKHWIQRSGMSVRCNRLVETLERRDNHWHVTSQSTDSGSTQTDTTADGLFDCVVLTMPVPQILQLKGDLQTLLAAAPDIRSKLERCTYSSRYALALFYNHPLNLGWTARYVADDDCVRFMAVDTKKRGVEAGGDSLVVHTSVEFGVRHLEEDRDTMQDVVLKHVYNVEPKLPKPDSIKCLKWRYSQTLEAYEGKPGCVVLSTAPLLILAGDSFSQSNLDGCIHSALACAQVIENHVTNPTRAT